MVVRIKPRLTVTSNEAAIDAAIGGLGICRLLSCQVGSAVDDGRLRVILANYEEEPLPVYVLHRGNKFGASKVRKFIDLLVEHLRAHAHLNAGQAAPEHRRALICA
ncbi:LysR substrate binding domain protein [compost metagenome]